MPPRKKYTDDQIERAIDMRAGGLGLKLIAERVGMSAQQVHYWWINREIHHARRVVAQRRAGMLAAQEQQAEIGPQDRYTSVDMAAVELRLTGSDVKLNRKETFAAFVALSRQELSAPEMARRIGVTTRTIERYRAKTREMSCA